MITFLETRKWVKSYSDLYYIVGKFIEPTKEEINSHHNYSRLTEYLTVGLNDVLCLLTHFV